MRTLLVLLVNSVCHLRVLYFIHIVLCKCVVTSTMRPAMVRLLVNNGLVRTWKEAVVMYADIWILFPSVAVPSKSELHEMVKKISKKGLIVE
jgi:hypothetical protein